MANLKSKLSCLVRNTYCPHPTIRLLESKCGVNALGNMSDATGVNLQYMNNSNSLLR